MLSSLMTGKEIKMNSYIKQSNVNFKREEDLIKLFEYYNK